MRQAVGPNSIIGKTFRTILQSSVAEKDSLLRNNQQGFKKGKYKFLFGGVLHCDRCRGPTLSPVNKDLDSPSPSIDTAGKVLYIGCLGDKEDRKL